MSDEPRPERVHLHGPGRAATSLAWVWQRSGHEVSGMSGGGDAGTADARMVLGSAVPHGDVPDPFPPHGILVIGVPDDAVADVAKELARRAPPAGAIALHLSGAQGRAALAPMAAAGWDTAAFHPLCSFPRRGALDPDLGGALVAIECEASRRERLFRLAMAAGGEPFELQASARSLYHLAAATIGNSVLAVVDLAFRAAREAGVPEDLARRGLTRLAQGALENAASHGPADALTGPVVRGDVATLTRHLEALDARLPDDRALYLALVRRLLPIVERRRDRAGGRRVAAWLEEQGT